MSFCINTLSAQLFVFIASFFQHQVVNSGLQDSPDPVLPSQVPVCFSAASALQENHAIDVCWRTAHGTSGLCFKGARRFPVKPSGRKRPGFLGSSCQGLMITSDRLCNRLENTGQLRLCRAIIEERFQGHSVWGKWKGYSLPACPWARPIITAARWLVAVASRCKCVQICGSSALFQLQPGPIERDHFTANTTTSTRQRHPSLSLPPQLVE